MRKLDLLRALASRRALVLAGAALAPSCQFAAPRPIDPLPPITPEVLQHFRLTAAPVVSEAADSAPLEPIHVLGQSARADGEALGAASAEIELEDVLRSVETHFPLVLAALEEVSIAEGQLLQSRGNFDTRLNAQGAFDLEGFYESDVFDFGVEQPLEFWGMNFSGGYRIGRGDFAVYDGKAKTNKDGEARLGMTLPLLQGRAIDSRRVALWRARLAREQAEPIVLFKRLEATRKAADSYWKWVGAGRKREIALRLLALAEDRTNQLELAVREGLLAPINLVENERLIVDRRQSLLRAERGVQQAALALSLYWRDEQGQPAVPADSALPYEFPTPRDVAEVFVPGHEDLALARRPEVRVLELEIARLELELGLAENDILPRLDLGVFGSQDYGGAANTPDDKDPFELTALLRFQLPIQRSLARGKVRETQAKIAKLTREAQFLGDSVRNDVRDVTSALNQSYQRIGQSRENVRLAAELAEAERVQLRGGQSDLLRVNLREQQAAIAAQSLVEVLEEHFRALAEYRAVVGLPYDEVVAGGAIGSSAPDGAQR